MLLLIAALALGAQPAACEGGCVQASAVQLFDLADQLYARGDKAGAADLLVALTRDKHPQLRAEARFRLAAVLESMGDLNGAVRALRDLLAEQPRANRARLELARILGRMGRAGEAKLELAQAERLGLPPEVEQNVRRFSSTLAAPRRRGLTVELTAGPDSNVNRSTGSQFVDTIIAPFQLDADARRQDGMGYSGSAQAYSRDALGGVTFLSDAALRADLYDKARFDDVQLSAGSGPELSVGGLTARPSFRYERRWYGGELYSRGVGGAAEASIPLSRNAQLALSASRVRQKIARNRDQDGWRSAVAADWLQALGPDTIARFSLRLGWLDARARPESVRQAGSGLLVARQGRRVTLFGEADYTRTDGLEPQFLFGKTRHDRRWDVTGGMILGDVKLGGFSPLARVTYTASSANIALYRYRRARLDVGVTRSF